MNVEELREQLEHLAGPRTRATAEAREAVRRRVGRRRRRINATSAAAGVLVIAIVGVGVLNAQDSQVKVRTVPSTASSLRDISCATGVQAVPARDVPKDVAAWADDAPVVGGGQLWTVHRLLAVEPTFDHGIWRRKIGWFAKPFGIPRIAGRRLDGRGTFHATANRAVNGSGTWVASTLEFSSVGCWEVTASLDRSQIVFRILFGDPPRPLAIGTIAGTLALVGGPTARETAIPGSITIEGGRAYSAGVLTSTGEFSVDVPVGSYTVSGTSPNYQGGDARCHATGPVVATRGRTTYVRVICAVR